MKYKGIIFDLDGVICFTDEYHFLAWKQLAIELGIKNFTREDNNRQRGVSRMDSLEVVLEKSDKKYTYEEKLAFADKKNNIYRSLLEFMSEKDLPADVKNTLFTLKETGIKLAIGSSSKNTMFILKKLGLDNFFDAVSDGNNITKSKPDPEVFLKAAQFINLKPRECLVIEDAYKGIDAAADGGFNSVGIGDASNYSKATYKIKSIKEILDIVK
jgi:beta-phosphoglucomutase